MPEISVIIPLYNAEKFIKRCFDSLRNQTFQDIEMIFVDDGSSDDSASILEEIQKQDNRVKIIHQENKRQGGARNTGVRAALGKYIAYVDIDDFVSEDFLSGLYNAIEKYDCDLATTSVIRHKEGKKERYLLKYDEEKLYTDLKEKVKIAYGNGTGRGVWNKIFKKDFLIKNNLFFRENVSYEDCDYCASALFLSNGVATTNVGKYFYFVNRKSTMRVAADAKKQQDKYIGGKLTALYELKNKMIDATSKLVNKMDYSCFGLNILRIKEKIGLEKTIEEWWLFDFIKIFQKEFKTSL